MHIYIYIYIALRLVDTLSVPIPKAQPAQSITHGGVPYNRSSAISDAFIGFTPTVCVHTFHLGILLLYSPNDFLVYCWLCCYYCCCL